MPAVLKIDRQRKLVCSTFYGEVNDGELLRQRSVIAADPDFDPGFSEVVDFSGVTLASISKSTLSVLADMKSVFSESVLHVVVAPADLPFQLALQYQALARETRPNLLIVRSLQEAYKLLGVGPGM